MFTNVKKAAETTFVRKTHAFNVDEIVTKDGLKLSLEQTIVFRMKQLLFYYQRSKNIENIVITFFLLKCQ